MVWFAYIIASIKMWLVGSRQSSQYRGWIAVLICGLYFQCVLKYCSVEGTKISHKHHREKITVSHEHRDHRSRKHRKHTDFKNVPQLSQQERAYLTKLEDALQSRSGKILFTNSWAVQLDPAARTRSARCTTTGIARARRPNFSSATTIR